MFSYDQLPIATVPDLSDQIERTTELIGRGGYGSVYKGRWLGAAANAASAIIAIKIIELAPLRDEAERTRRFKKITRELSLWCSIQHENILPLLGIARINDDTNVPAFVCPWMENGNAKEFRKHNPDFPPILILYNIINGLHYLHTSQPEIVHGDIKAVNVVINNRCEACLCDFGLSRFLIDNTLWKTTATQAGGTLRWMAPELFEDATTPTKESDIYAYAMTCYEILSGDVPFKSVLNEGAIIRKVTKGQRPDRIESFHSDFMWDIITRCWEQEPAGRLPTKTVLELLQPTVDWKIYWKKEVEEAQAKIGEKDVALAKVEKEMAVLKEQMAEAMAKTEDNLKALKEEKEKTHELETKITIQTEEIKRLQAILEKHTAKPSSPDYAAEQRIAEKEEKIARLVSEVAHLNLILEEKTTALSSAKKTNQWQHEEIRQMKTARLPSTDGGTPLPPAVVNKADTISAVEVAVSVMILNAQIEQASSLIMDSLDQEMLSTGKELETLWDELNDDIGSSLCNDLKRRSKELIVEPDPLIIQLTLQTGLVNACSRIINDWNPPFGIDGSVSSRTYSSIAKTSGQATADGRKALSRTHMTVLQSDRQEANKRYLMEVFLRLITAVGGSLESGGILLSQYKEKVEDIVQKAVGLHKTVSEDVTSMELATYTSPSDTPFDASRMEDAEGDESERRRLGSDRVVCTVEMGLRCRKKDEPGRSREEWGVVMKSKVVLASSLGA
ncbi:Protein kinase-like domain containing protein [Amanita muscaria]